MTRRTPLLTRRRALTILAAGAGLAALAPWLPARARLRYFEWTGTAMGAEATIRLVHDDRAAAEAAVEMARAEIDRLEDLFSLYRPDSELSRLNHAGVVVAPSQDMRRIMALARRFGDLSGGAFDVTVQPLWRLYADHFAEPHADSAGPSRAAIRGALAMVDYRRIAVTAETIALAPGMAVTLNGIAQGYVTDRVAELLHRHGWSHVLVNLGETRALDGRADGSPWTVALDGTQGDDGTPMVIPLADRAVATSGGYATRFEPSGRHHHLFDPRTGESGRHYRTVTVVADDASTADALSTALYVTAPERAVGLVHRAGGVEAWLTGADDRTRRVTG
jgi:FAD:protein FMN transferase